MATNTLPPYQLFWFNTAQFCILAGFVGTKVNFVGEGPLTSEVSKVTLVRNWDEARGTPRGRGRQQLERGRYR